MNHAIDRSGIVRAALEGRGKEIWASITPGNRVWHNDKVQTYPHSTDKARKILDGLGWVDRDGDGIREDDKGRTIEFSLNTNVDNQVRQKVGTLIQADLKAVGVKVNLKEAAPLPQT